MKRTIRRFARKRATARPAVRRFLELETRRLERAMTHQQELIKLSDGALGELLEQAAEATERTQHIAVLEQFARELAQVKRARERLRIGRYGVCERCGHPIPAARLDVLPYATLCVPCQTIRSRRRNGA